MCSCPASGCASARRGTEQVQEDLLLPIHAWFYPPSLGIAVLWSRGAAPAAPDLPREAEERWIQDLFEALGEASAGVNTSRGCLRRAPERRGGLDGAEPGRGARGGPRNQRLRVGARQGEQRKAARLPEPLRGF